MIRKIFLQVMILIILLPIVYSDLEGSHLPNTASADSDCSSGGAWSNINNIKQESGLTDASMAAGGSTQCLKATNFSFSIPSNATILGIEARIKKESAGLSGANDKAIQLIKDGTVSGKNNVNSTAWPTTSGGTNFTYGNSTDLWNVTWLPEDINNASFGIAMAANNSAGAVRTAYVYVVEITVYYTTWWNQSFNKRQNITFSQWTGSGTDNLTDFPVLVKLNSSNFNYNLTNDDASDLRFIDSNDSTLLNHEIELWNESGDSFVWVKVPLLENSSTDYIWMYYSNNTGVSSGENKTGVWDSDYVGVWHLKNNGGSLDANDSTLFGNDGTINEAILNSSGKADGAGKFDGINDYINVSDSNFLDQTSGLTFEAWFYPESVGTESRIGGKAGAYVIRLLSDGIIQLAFGSAVSASDVNTTTSVSNNTWYYLVGAYNSTTGSEIYINSILEGNNSANGDLVVNTNNFFIASSTGNSNWFNGNIDEVRISNISRSAAWINATYLFIGDPFVASSLGTTEDKPEGITPSVSLISPENNINSSDSAPDFIFTVTDLSSNQTINSTVYLDNGTTFAVASDSRSSPLSNVQITETSNTTLSDGNYTWWVNISDGVEEIKSEVRTINIDSTIPLISYSAGTETNNSNLSRSYIFVNTSVTEANFKNLTFSLYNSSALVNSTTFTDSTRSINFTSLSDEIYTFNVTVYDYSGNSNSTGSRTVTLDTLNPQINYSGGTETDGNNLSQNYIFINISLTEINLKNTTFNLYNSSNLVNSTTFTDSTKEINFTNLSDEVYTFNVTVYDWANNINSTETRTVTLDTTRPLVSFLNGTEANNTNLTRDWIFLNVSFSDATSGIKNITYYLYNSSELVNNTTLNSPASPDSINFTNLLDGDYFFNSTVYDFAGNNNSTETRLVNVEVQNPLIDYTSGTPSNSSELNQSYLFVNVSIVEGNFRNITFNLYNSTSLVNETSFSSLLSDNSRNVNFTSLADGTYYFNATVYDFSNKLNFTETRFVTIDTSVPDEGEEESGSGGGNGGGSSGGSSGGGSIGIVTKPKISKLIVFEKQFVLKLNRGEKLTEFLTIENVGNIEENISVSISKLEEFLEIRDISFILAQGRTKDLALGFSVPEDHPVVTREGSVIVKYSNGSISIPVFIEIIEKKPLLDLNAEIVDVSDFLRYNIEIFNLGETGRIDVFLITKILEGNEIILEEEETIAIETSSSITRGIDISGLEGEKLTLEIEALYNLGEEEITARAKKTFFVEKTKESDFDIVAILALIWPFIWRIGLGVLAFSASILVLVSIKRFLGKIKSKKSSFIEDRDIKVLRAFKETALLLEKEGYNTNELKNSMNTIRFYLLTGKTDLARYYIEALQRDLENILWKIRERESQLKYC